ncbi:TetR/AcrR family transcriptional regulator [Roseibium denhamense]|uniref:Transcriptional regulator, TetR family n=1 Tax=Roseibium denhamense TaxID=76305 RepID=A0ABY1N9X7_9HYPH|nr:TetR/AcrR family transcriptional regulator [Roseibium denhamense]MTI06509.1 TetR/AcrR family transcriptional regulator [Roseibium denhamense]SMP04381.1 transcriptional regulator, TetR family [Roseibium denhamense]
MPAAAYDIATARPDAAPEFSPRQQVVLQHALKLLVEGGEKALTTAGLARTASCSKESLYKWFGDRDGLLAAVVAYQASQVQFPSESGATADPDTFRAHVTAFVEALLGVLFSESSLALNRLSIGQSNTNSNKLGELLLVRGKHMISSRARTMLETGRRHALLKFDDADDAYQVLYGLAIRDVHIRLLLGETATAEVNNHADQAARAVDRFYRLFGA